MFKSTNRNDLFCITAQHEHLAVPYCSIRFPPPPTIYIAFTHLLVLYYQAPRQCTLSCEARLVNCRPVAVKSTQHLEQLGNVKLNAISVREHHYAIGTVAAASHVFRHKFPLQEQITPQSSPTCAMARVVGSVAAAQYIYIYAEQSKSTTPRLV